MTWRVITMLVITMVVAGMLAVGAAREASTGRRAGDGLVGTTWHTVRIDGDALFFFIQT